MLALLKNPRSDHRESIKHAITEEGGYIGNRRISQHFQELATSSLRSVTLSGPVVSTTGRNNGYILMVKLPETLSDRIGVE